MKSTTTQIEFDRQLDKLKIREFRKTGDLNLLKSLFSKYVHLVYGLSLNCLDDRSKAIETVSLVYEKLRETVVVQEIENLKAWLYVKTKDLCFEELKAAGNVDSLAWKQWQIDRTSTKASYSGTLFLERFQNRNRAFMKALDTLPITEKTCVDWFYGKEKPMSEIAKLMDMEECDVRALLRKVQKDMSTLYLSNDER